MPSKSADAASFPKFDSNSCIPSNHMSVPALHLIRLSVRSWHELLHAMGTGWPLTNHVRPPVRPHATMVSHIAYWLWKWSDIQTLILCVVFRLLQGLTATWWQWHAHQSWIFRKHLSFSASWLELSAGYLQVLSYVLWDYHLFDIHKLKLNRYTRDALNKSDLRCTYLMPAG